MKKVLNIRIENDILAIRSMSKIEEENQIKLIQDLTEQTIQESKYFHDFPNNLKILQAKLYEAPDGWDGKECRLVIQYEINGTMYTLDKPVYTDVKNILIDMLFCILDHYNRCYKVQ